MNANCFVDTNILIYAHDRAAGAKHKRARQVVGELWEARRGVISTQVLQEFCVNAHRRIQPPVAEEQLRLIVQTYMAWNVVVNTAGSVIQALDVAARHRISFWDALIVNAAEEGACEILYSEDLSSNQQYGSVLVINPFA